MKVGEVIAGWEILEFINQGGNGVVWRAQKNGKEAAFKVLQKRHLKSHERATRFHDEIAVMIECQDLSGVLPLLDYQLPKKPSAANLPWYCTELAVPMPVALDAENSVDDILKACIGIAEVVSQLHARNISHRDIKPENLFVLDGIWMVGDFGLASFPEKGEITPGGEKLGPLFYIAPEMLNNPNTAEGKAADVYSLAKLLWKLLTGQAYPLPGPHSATEPISSVKTFVSDPRATKLDKLIEAATHLEPKRRIVASDFAGELRAALSGPVEIPESFSGIDLTDLSDVFDQVSNLDWNELSKRRTANNSDERTLVRVFLKKLMPLVNELCDEMNKQNLETKARVTLQQGGPTHIQNLFDLYHNGDYLIEQLVFQADVRPSIHVREFEFVGGLCFFSPYRRDEHGHEYLKGADAFTGAAYFIRDNNIELPDGLIQIWATHSKVICAGPSENEVVARMAQGLSENFGSAVAHFLRYVVERAEDVV